MELAEVRDELYALPPDRFTAQRDTAVKQARRAGDGALAARIGQLRRPTVSAWLVNLLARRRGPALDELLALGGALRAAQDGLAGAEMRRLAQGRDRLVTALVADAHTLAEAVEHRVSPAAAEELTATLQAAVVDPQAAAAVRSGHLVTALRHSGFGWGERLGPAAATGGVPARAVALANRATARTAAGRSAAGPDTARVAAVADKARRAAERALQDARRAAEQADSEVAAARARQAAALSLVGALEAQLERARHEAGSAAEQLKQASRAARITQRRAEQAGRAVEQHRQRPPT